MHKAEEMREWLEQVQKAQENLNRKLSLVIRVTDEMNRADALKDLGITDTLFDLKTAAQKMQLDIDGAFSINDTIQDFERESAKATTLEKETKETKETTVVDDIFGGINF